MIGRLLTERAELAALPTPGLSDDEASALERFAEDVRAGVEAATPADRRRIYELLRLRVRAYQDPAGERLARSHRFRLECDAIIGLERVRGEKQFW